jgi:hypothetical protein
LNCFFVTVFTVYGNKFISELSPSPVLRVTNHVVKLPSLGTHSENFAYYGRSQGHLVVTQRTKVSHVELPCHVVNKEGEGRRQKAWWSARTHVGTFCQSSVEGGASPGTTERGLHVDTTCQSSAVGGAPRPAILQRTRRRSRVPSTIFTWRCVYKQWILNFF